MSLLELYCHVDDFWQAFASHWEQEQLQSGEKSRHRDGQLCGSEIMTILIYFHIFRQRDFKTFYTQVVQVQLRGEFPNLVSYNRFVELMPSILVPLCAYLRYCCDDCSGVSFIDSTPFLYGGSSKAAVGYTLMSGSRLAIARLCRRPLLKTTNLMLVCPSLMQQMVRDKPQSHLMIISH